MTTPSSYPRSVTPGIETPFDTPELPEPGIYVGLDWIRCTGPESLRWDVESFLHEWFGGDREPNSGAKWFKAGLMWSPGVLLSLEHRSDICQVDIQGKRLRLMEGGQRIALLKELMSLGMKPTRLDGALDYIGQDLGLCVEALESCERGELCLFRRYSPNGEFTASGVPTRRLLKLGSRESSVCARIYDKGLEQSIAPPGYWERFETEFKADRAKQVARMLVDGGVEWPGLLSGFVLGAVDFREKNGRSELERRPRVAWWASLLANQDLIRTSAAGTEQSFEKWIEWYRACAGPRLKELARASHQCVGDLCERLLVGVVPGSGGGPIIAGGIAWIRSNQDVRATATRAIPARVTLPGC